MLANDLRDIATVALASRLCVVTLAVLSDLLLPDHQAQGALLAPFDCGVEHSQLQRF